MSWALLSMYGFLSFILSVMGTDSYITRWNERDADVRSKRDGVEIFFVWLVLFLFWVPLVFVCGTIAMAKGKL